MLISRNMKLDPSDEIHSRILKTEGIQTQTTHLLNLFSHYSSSLTQLNMLEQQIAAQLRLLYTDYSIFSPLILKLKEAVDYKATVFIEDIAKLRAVIEYQRNMESDAYKPLKASINNYFERSKTYEHYKKKLPKLVSPSERTGPDTRINSRDLEKLQRNERKLENSKNDTDIYIQQIIDQTNFINLERFNRINPLVKIFTALQLKESLKQQEKFIEVENVDQVLDNRESDIFNHKFFEPAPETNIRNVLADQGFSQIRSVVTNHHGMDIARSRVMEGDGKYMGTSGGYYLDTNATNKQDLRLSVPEVRSFHDGESLRLSQVSDRQDERVVERR